MTTRREVNGSIFFHNHDPLIQIIFKKKRKKKRKKEKECKEKDGEEGRMERIPLLLIL